MHCNPINSQRVNGKLYEYLALCCIKTGDNYGKHIKIRIFVILYCISRWHGRICNVSHLHPIQVSCNIDDDGIRRRSCAIQHGTSCTCTIT